MNEWMNSCDYEQIVVHAELFAKFSPNIYKIKFKSSCKGIAFHSIYNYITGIQSTTHKCHSQQPITAQRHPSHSNLHSLECVLCSHWMSHTYTHMHTVYEITARRAAKIYSTKYHPTYAYMHWPIAYAHICRIAHLNDIFHVFRFLAFNEISTDHNSHNTFVAKVITF